MPTMKPATSGKPVRTTGTSQIRSIQRPVAAMRPSGWSPSIGSTGMSSGTSRSRPRRFSPNSSATYVHRNVHIPIPIANQVAPLTIPARTPSLGERADCEHDRHSSRSEKWAGRAVDAAEHAVWRRSSTRRSERLQITYQSAARPHREPACEAQRRVVRDDQESALFPDRAGSICAEQKVGTGVEPRQCGPCCASRPICRRAGEQELAPSWAATWSGASESPRSPRAAPLQDSPSADPF